ncbi:MAG: hypothetical protein ACLUQB_13640 [Lachnospiraceae bacterium]
MTTETLEEAVQAAKISLAEFHEAPVLVNLGRRGSGGTSSKASGSDGSEDCPNGGRELPELNEDGIFTEVTMEKQEWKNRIKAR